MRRKHRPMRILGKKKSNKWSRRIPTAPPNKIFSSKKYKKPKHKEKIDETYSS